MRIKEIRSRSQYDLVLDPDVIWSSTQTSFGPRPRRDTGPDHEATQSRAQIDKFIYPRLPLMKPHFFTLLLLTRYPSSNTNNFMQYRLQVGIYPACHAIKKGPFSFPTVSFTKPPRQQGPPQLPKEALPTSRSIQFRISIYAEFGPISTLLIQQGRATTPFQRAGLIPQFSK